MYIIGCVFNCVCVCFLILWMCACVPLISMCGFDSICGFVCMCVCLFVSLFVSLFCWFECLCVDGCVFGWGMCKNVSYLLCKGFEQNLMKDSFFYNFIAKKETLWYL